MLRCLVFLFSLTQLIPSLATETIVAKSHSHQTAIVELYTSEGCSSCPPADQWLSQLIKVPAEKLDVLALAFHVDYWDYIGWKDEFASPRYSERQRKLALINRQNTIYTPEFFVDGIETRGTEHIIQRIRKTNQIPSKVELELSLDNREQVFQLNLASLNRTKQKLLVQFIVFENELSNQVQRGENAGRELHHQRVVRYLSPELTLQPQVQHDIAIKPEWNPQHLGIAAIVFTPDQNYIQSIYTLLD